MPSNKQQTGEYGTEFLVSWKFPEFEQYDRGRGWWYVFYGFCLISLLYAIFTKNFLFALIVIIVSAIVVHRHYHEPEEVSMHITKNGIMVGDESYEWKDLGSFWLAYEPPEVKKLFFTFSSKFRPHLTIPLEDEDPIKIREILSTYLTEDLDKESEPTVELLGRVLRL